MGTIRQDMTELLRERTLSAMEISQELSLRERDVYDHLNHISRSLKSSKEKEKLVTLPARCMSCGFVFKEKSRQSRPGRCPQCKKSHIESPRYRVE